MTCDGEEMTTGQVCGIIAGFGQSYEEIAKEQREAYESRERISSAVLRTSGPAAAGAFLAAMLVLLLMPRRAPTAAPARVERLAQRRGLGVFQRGYRRAAGFGLFVAVGGLVLATAGYLLVGTDMLETPLSGATKIGVLVLAVVAGVAGLFWVLRVLMRLPRGVYRYAGGMADDRWTPSVFTWEQVDDMRAVTAVNTGNPPIRYRRYELRGRDFKRTVWDSDTVRDIADLGDALVANVTAAQMPGVLTRLSTGQAVEFGPKMTADQRGLTVAGRRVSWGAVPQLRFAQNGHTVVFPAEDGGQVEVPQRDIANLPLLRVLATQADQPS